ncbi:MAG: ATP-binding cassette domain-containing protein [Methylobacter sp.]|nr:ATP-binding cassette domain-containing protein [Methylobacter sp.]MDP3054144.1 ATP-binding cassette domain-containing protein [Methylobacter sp.]MDP3361233.1 ATP-binding cassette domain-containing protein [Methylobacter sp.]MDZ4220179.1 ATP-binding cassette domain-containing protein [Methylobacter sp.]
MPASAEFKESTQRKKTMQTLLGFLLGLLELDTEPAKSLDRLIHLDFDDSLDVLPEIGDNFGLRMDRVALTPTAAAEASGAQTPLVACLAEGRGWLVVYGFKAGRVRVALVQGEVIEERRLKPAEVGQQLGLTTGLIGDWFLVQAKAPLANAVSHDAHAHLSPLRRLIELMRADHADLWLVLGMSLGSGLLALASPVTVQALVNTVTMGGMGQPLLVLSIILFFFLTFAGAVQVLTSYLVEIVQRRIFVRLAADLAYRLPRVRRDAYAHHEGVELVNRFFDVLTVQKAGSALLLDGLSTAVQTCVGLIMLAFYHPFLLAFDVILLLSISVIIFVLGRGGVATSINESVSKYALVAWLEVIAGNMQTFKFSGGPELAAKRTDKLALAYLANKRRHYRILLRQVIGSVALYAIASTALLAIGGYLVIDGHLTLGQLVAAELIVSSALVSLVKFGKHLEGYYDLMAGSDKIGYLLDLPLEQEYGLTPIMKGPAALAIRDLSFSFSAKRPLFSQFNCQLQPGEKVAVLARFGGGKTLLASLLCGLRPLQKGSIEINAVDLASLRLEALRRHIAVISGIEIIGDTLLENVRLGREELSLDQIRQVLDAVGLSEEIVGHDMDVELTPGGSPLSATQALLLMLARAMVGKPSLLILDAVLDDMDEGSRNQIAPLLFAADAPWTLLVLTASPAVAALCERVVPLTGADTHG